MNTPSNSQKVTPQCLETGRQYENYIGTTMCDKCTRKSHDGRPIYKRAGTDSTTVPFTGDFRLSIDCIDCTTPEFMRKDDQFASCQVLRDLALKLFKLLDVQLLVNDYCRVLQSLNQSLYGNSECKDDEWPNVQYKQFIERDCVPDRLRCECVGDLFPKDSRMNSQRWVSVKWSGSKNGIPIAKYKDQLPFIQSRYLSTQYAGKSLDTQVNVCLLQTCAIIASCVAGSNLSGFMICWDASKFQTFLRLDELFSLPIVKYCIKLLDSDMSDLDKRYQAAALCSVTPIAGLNRNFTQQLFTQFIKSDSGICALIGTTPDISAHKYSFGYQDIMQIDSTGAMQDWVSAQMGDSDDNSDIIQYAFNLLIQEASASNIQRTQVQIERLATMWENSKYCHINMFGCIQPLDRNFYSYTSECWVADSK